MAHELAPKAASSVDSRESAATQPARVFSRIRTTLKRSVSGALVIGALLAPLLPSELVLAQRLPRGARDCNFLCKWVPPADQIQKNFGQASQPALRQGPLNIIAWNVYKGRFDTFPPIYRQKTKGMDLILLSEATDGELVFPVVAERPGFAWQMSINFYMKNNVATGLLSGSKVAPTYTHAVQTQDLEPFVRSPKTLLFTKYPVNDSQGRRLGEILAINIHGINWAGDDAFLRHLRLAELVLRDHRGPVIFAGDFNTKNAKRFEMFKAFGQRHGLVRAPWENPITDDDQLDDALIRGFDVHRAVLADDVVGTASDHPALLLRLTPRWDGVTRMRQPRPWAFSVR